MTDIEKENELLKQYLIDAMDIADFVVNSGSGIFIKQHYWSLRLKIEQAGIELNPRERSE